MKVVMWLGIAYCVYGLLYLLGIPHVAPKYRNRTWTRRYQRTCGIGWLMIGAGAVCPFRELPDCLFPAGNVDRGTGSAVYFLRFPLRKTFSENRR